MNPEPVSHDWAERAVDRRHEPSAVASGRVPLRTNTVERHEQFHRLTISLVVSDETAPCPFCAARPGLIVRTLRRLIEGSLDDDPDLSSAVARRRLEAVPFSTLDAEPEGLAASFLSSGLGLCRPERFSRFTRLLEEILHVRPDVDLQIESQASRRESVLLEELCLVRRPVDDTP